jgi:hypothetical protein
MKTFLATALTVLPSIAFASGSWLAFPDTKIVGAPHSLEESAQLGVPSLTRDWSPISPPIMVSRMPVIAPGVDCDPKMVVKPDGSREYKLTIIAPILGSQK